MTLDDVALKLDELYRINGRDYVVHAGNHPDILRAIKDSVIAELEAEREEIVAGEKKRKLEDLTVDEICEIAAQAGRRAAVKRGE